LFTKLEFLQISQFIIGVKRTWFLLVFKSNLFKVVKSIVVITLVNIFGKLTFWNVFIVENCNQNENYCCDKDKRSEDEILRRL